MLFVIDQTVAELFETGSASIKDAECLDNIMLGAAEGNHRIVGTRSVLQILSKQADLQAKTRNALNRALSRVAQEGRLDRQVSCYGRIVVGPGSLSSSVVNGQRIVILPLRWFDISAKIQPTKLLGEDLTDVEIWKIIGETGSHASGLVYVPISLTPVSGGGSQTAPNLSAIILRGQQLCLCIVDSDRGAPGGLMGGTAQKVQVYKNDALYPLIEVTETRGRDLENMLPSRFYSDAYPSTRSNAALSNAISIMNRTDEFDVTFHLDIEKGFHLRMLFKHLPGTIERIFWDTKLPVITSHMGISQAALPCLGSGVCNNANDTPCSCSIITGNSTDILETFVLWFQTKDRYKLTKLLDDFLLPEWKRIGLLVASWCFGDERMRS